MRIRTTLVSLAAGLVLCATQASAAIVITVGNSTASSPGTATFDVTLSGVAEGGTPANNAQLDIIFPTATFDIASAAAVCTLDSRFASGFQHTESLPTSPNPGAGNQRLRLNIIDNSEPLGGVTDGKLYTCAFPVKAGASGAVTLTAGRQNVGDTAGNVLTSSTVNGTVSIGGGEPLTPTPTTTGGVEPLTPTPSATVVIPSGIVIRVGDSTASSPGTATFDVTLSGVAAGGTPANNAQVDIIFATASFDVAAATVCTLNPRFASGFQHTESLPTSPNPGAGNQRLRLNIIDNSEPLGGVTDGVLYTCAFPVKSGVSGAQTLTATRQNVGDTAGNVLTSSTVNGTVSVGEPPVGTATPTNTVPVVATNTPTVTNTQGAQLTATPTRTNTAGGGATSTPTARTATPTPTRTPGTIEDEDGCQMAAHGTANGWMLLIPAMMVLGLRRRAR